MDVCYIVPVFHLCCHTTQYNADYVSIRRMLARHAYTTVSLAGSPNDYTGHTQNVSVTKIVDSSSMQRAETKYGLIIQFFGLVFIIHEVWLNA